jgi:hypothetical protein
MDRIVFVRYVACGERRDAHEALERALMTREQLMIIQRQQVNDGCNQNMFLPQQSGTSLGNGTMLRRGVTILRMHPPSPELATALDHLGQALAAGDSGKKPKLT